MLTIQAGRLVPGLLMVFGMAAPGNAGTILIDPSTSVSGTVSCYNGRYNESVTIPLFGQGAGPVSAQCDAHGWRASASWDGKTESVFGDGNLELIDFSFEGLAEIGVTLALKAVGGSGPGVLRLHMDCGIGGGVDAFGVNYYGCYRGPDLDIPFTYGQVFHIESGLRMGSSMGGSGSMTYSWTIVSDAAVPEPATFSVVFAAAAFGIGLRRYCTGC